MPDLRYRPCRDNRDPLAVLEWQIANDWEGFIPTPMGEARRWLQGILMNADPEKNEASRHAAVLLEHLEFD